jgi:hypothetical protein
VAKNIAIDDAGLEKAADRLAKTLAGFKLRDNAFHLLTLASAFS